MIAARFAARAGIAAVAGRGTGDRIGQPAAGTRPRSTATAQAACTGMVLAVRVTRLASSQ